MSAMPEAALRALRARTHLRGLYGMVDLATESSPSGSEAEARAVALANALATSLLDGGARVLQLRMKRAGAGLMLAVAQPLLALCRARGALLVINDRLDVALAAGADGVHLGQDDLPLASARALAPPSLLIGISTHDEDQARAADAGGADYLGFGPLFPTRTKENPDPVVGLARLAAVCAQARVPVVGIGGIELSAAPAVAQAGAAAAAVIAAVNRADDVVAAARAVQRAFDR